MTRTEETKLTDLTIEVDVRDGKTMSRYRVPRNGRVKFRNVSSGLLVVTPKSGQPFCEPDKKTVIPAIKVDPRGGESIVHICRAFKDDEFLYTAKIEEALADDPIVIIE